MQIKTLIGSSEQSQGVALVNGSVNRLPQMTQQQVALVAESTAAAESLRERAQKLSEVLLSFNLEPKTAPLRQASHA